MHGPLSTLVPHLRRLAGEATGADPTDTQLLQQFVATGDEAAFATLVRRHERLLRAACRRAVPCPHDAEDAFQATLLVFARKARSIRKGISLASWLYGVAYRVAMNARKSALRRREREKKAAGRAVEQPVAEAALRELQALLDVEVQRLPEKLRAPFVLCCLEGKSKSEAARELGWREGTVSTRLAAARARLRQQLARRGVTLSAVLCAVALPVDGAEAAVPVTTVRAVLAWAAGRPGAVPAVPTALAEALLKGVSMNKPTLVAGLLVGLGVLIGGVGLAAHQAQALLQPEAKQQEGSEQTAEGRQRQRPDGESPGGTDLYGDPLPLGAIARMGTVLWRLDSGGVRCMAVPWDGKRLVTVNPQTGVFVWDLGTGKAVRQLPGQAELRKAWLGGQTAVALSADGGTVAFGLADGTIHLLAIETGEEKPECRGHQGPIQEAALSGDGRVLVTRSGDQTLRVWQTASGKEICRMPLAAKQPSQYVPAELALSRDGRTLAWIDNDPGRVIHVCDAASGAERHQLGEHAGDYRQVVFSADGQTLLAASDGGPGQAGIAQLWDLKTGKVLHTWKHGKGQSWLPTAAFAPDGKTVVVTMGGDGMYRFDLATGKELWHVERRLVSTVQDVHAFTPDGTMLVVVPLGGPTLHRYDMATGKRLVAPVELTTGFNEIAFSPDERTLYSLHEDGVLRTWETATGKEIRRTVIGASRGSFSPDGQVLAVTKEGVVHLIEPATGKELRRLAARPQNVHRLIYSPDGRTLLTWGNVDGMVLWDPATGKELRRLPRVKEPFYDLAFRADGKYLLGCGQQPDSVQGGVIRVWDVATGQESQVVPVPGPMYLSGMAVSPDGRTVALPGDQATHVVLWEVATGRKRLELEEPGASRPLSARYSPDGRLLLVLEPGGVQLFDTWTGQAVRLQGGHRGGMGPITVSPSGRLVATHSTDDTALVWKAADFLQARHPEAVGLSAAELSSLWADLADGDAGKAYQAIGKLARAPGQAVPWLHAHMRAVRRLEAEDRKRLEQLLADLDSDRFEVRTRAAEELEKFEELAGPAFEKVLAGNPSAEVRAQVEKLAARSASAGTPERLRALRAVEVLEQAGTGEARRLLEALAQGASEARLTQEATASLERLSGWHPLKP
jgi:RNA polymerase sigma factor (sigma-70 family)